MTKEADAVASAVKRAAGDPYARKVMAAAQTTPRGPGGVIRNRVEEIIHFCGEMGYSTAGVAFCVALAEEAQALCEVLSEAGLAVVPVGCKVGGIGPSQFGVDTDNAHGVSCNPVAQAEILNSRDTDLNIALGLCLGHDILFAHHSGSPVTTLVVKDRAVKHCTVEILRNPVRCQATAKETG
jgi:uncharacterized metal-binding protein